MVNDADTVELSAGNKLMVNGKDLKNSIGDVYVFSQAEVAMLSLYIKDKKIPKGTYFIF